MVWSKEKGGGSSAEPGCSPLFRTDGEMAEGGGMEGGGKLLMKRYSRDGEMQGIAVETQIRLLIGPVL